MSVNREQKSRFSCLELPLPGAVPGERHSLFFVAQAATLLCWGPFFQKTLRQIVTYISQFTNNPKLAHDGAVALVGLK